MRNGSGADPWVLRKAPNRAMEPHQFSARHRTVQWNPTNSPQGTEPSNGTPPIPRKASNRTKEPHQFFEWHRTPQMKPIILVG